MKKICYDTIIIGAGAAGLMAACELSKNSSSILVIDRMDASGKKILATGNGKCNMTNLYMEKGVFRGSGGELAYQASQKMTPEMLRGYFLELGLLTMERNGYVYPITEQAKTVVKTLLFHLKERKVNIHHEERVTSVIYKIQDKDTSVHQGQKYSGNKSKDRAHKSPSYLVKTDKGEYEAFNVILACGGKASPNLGSDGSGYDLLKQLGIETRKPLPALTGLVSSKKAFKNLAGVRTKGCISYFGKDGHFYKEEGEIQLAAYGISGIPVFQISRYVIEDLESLKKSHLLQNQKISGEAVHKNQEGLSNKKKKNEDIILETELDFFPDLTFHDLKNTLMLFRNIEGAACEDVLGGLVHEKWVPVLLGESGISPKDKPDTVPEKKWNKLVQLLKQYPIPIKGYRDFDFAQVTQGGAISSEIGENMESVRYPGLYLVGELVDVDGTCGGYNLHWAFTSGYLAAKDIEHKYRK